MQGGSKSASGAAGGGRAGSSVIKKDLVRRREGVVRTEEKNESGATLHTETVSNVVRELVVRCTCGQETRIECLYEDGDSEKPAAPAMGGRR